MNETPVAGWVWIPRTPAGSDLGWLACPTEAQAWAALLQDAAHMPYQGISGFKARGYSVHRWEAAPEVLR